MQKVITLAGFLLIAAVALAALAGSEGQTPASSLLSHLKAGQSVKLEQATSGGYNVNILNERYLKSYAQADNKYIPPKIIVVGPDSITVELSGGMKRIIAAHAIDVITELPAEEPKTKEAETKAP
jgi:hypothetical protein